MWSFWGVNTSQIALLAPTAISAAPLATTCVWIWLFGFMSFSQEVVIVGSTYTLKKKKKIQRLNTTSSGVLSKGFSKKITKLSGRRLNQVEGKWIKPEYGTSHFFGSTIHRVQQMGRLVVWWGAIVFKCSVFKLQLKDFVFRRRHPHLAVQLRKWYGSPQMFFWKYRCQICIQGVIPSIFFVCVKLNNKD